jgi:hypothetical protein
MESTTIKDILENTKLNNPLTVRRSWMEYFQTKNFVILLLVVVILLLFLGINILSVIANIFQMIVYALKPLITSILVLFGVSINTIGDFFESIGNIIDSVLHIFGDGLQNISKYPLHNSYRNNNDNNDDDIQPSDTNLSTQQPTMSQNKQKWCLIGDTPGSKTCIPIQDSTKCMSGMTYDDEQTCTNPTTTDNNPITQTVSGNGNLGSKTNSTFYPNANGDVTAGGAGGAGGAGISSVSSLSSVSGGMTPETITNLRNRLNYIKSLPQDQQIIELQKDTTVDPLSQEILQMLKNMSPQQKTIFLNAYFKKEDEILSFYSTTVPANSLPDSSMSSKPSNAYGLQTTLPAATLGATTGTPILVTPGAS